MKAIKQLIATATLIFAVASAAVAKERLLILNEGNWQSDNGRLSYFEDGRIVSNEWFRQVNGYKLGDTPNDIIQVNDNLIAMAINWSNIVQFITPEGKAVAATEDIPNNRKLATDGDYVYVSSYGHECMVDGSMQTFTRGYVAKIDVRTFQVVSAVEVGYEPEGIALYKGLLFVANTGGYAFNEGHEYETTVSVIDAATMSVVRTVDTETINLYGKMSQSGRYLCINSPGDYYDEQAAMLVFDCQAVVDDKPDAECFHKLEYAATYNCVDVKGNFYAIGSRYSYYTGDYEYNYIIVDPAEVFASDGTSGISQNFPGTVCDDFKKIQMPYGIYVNPYTGYIYATDAGEFVAAGSLLQWTPDGEYVGTYKLYINPGHFLALKDESGIADVVVDNADAPTYNLQGMRVTDLVPGNIYIRNGAKFLYTK